jgi:hypothetical protein
VNIQSPLEILSDALDLAENEGRITLEEFNLAVAWIRYMQSKEKLDEA